MKLYMMSQKKDSGCPLGLLDATLYDKIYENWGEVEYGAFPWYANSARHHPHEKMPEGMVLVGAGKKYCFGARRLINDLYAISDSFYNACEKSGVVFQDVVRVSFKVGGGRRENPGAYHVAVFKSYAIEEVIKGSLGLVRDEYNMVESFGKLELNDVENAVFKISGLSPYINTLFCSEEFKNKAEEVKVLGVDFYPIEEWGSEKIYPL